MLLQLTLTRLKMKTIKIFLFLILLFNLEQNVISNEGIEVLNKSIFTKINDDTLNHNYIIIAMDLKSCYSCNMPRINGIFNNLKELILNSSTILAIESEIPKDSYALKNNFISDYFIEDTSKILSKNNFMFPYILIKDIESQLFKIHFDDLMSSYENFDKINYLINSENYIFKKRLNIHEANGLYFSDLRSPFIYKNKLQFLAKRRNEILNFDLINKTLAVKFAPDLFYLSKLTKIRKTLMDSFNIIDNLNYYFNIKDIDYDYIKNQIQLFSENLIKLEYNANNIYATTGNGIINIDNNHYTKFNKIINNDFNSFNNYLNRFIFNLKYYSENSKIKDSLALILNVDKEGNFDTLVTVKDLKLKKYEYKYSINELVDYLEAAEGEQFFLCSSKLQKIYKYQNKKITSFSFKGVSSYYKEFDIQDMMIMDNKIYIVGLSDTKRLLIQSYDFDGKLLKEDIWYLNDDILLNTRFVKNDTEELILMNKWRYKRWTLDYLEK